MNDTELIHSYIENDKKAVRTALVALKSWATYDQLVSLFEINRKELNRLVRQSDYEPPAWVWVKLGVQVYELAPVCPVHGKACVLNCATEKAVPVAARVSLPGKPRQRAPRIEIALSDPEKARARLEQALQEMK